MWSDWQLHRPRPNQYERRLTTIHEALPEEDYFYFVHSYRAVPASEEYTVGQTEYGGRFAAAVARDNAFAVQFHPEKSQGAGRRLLDAFAAWVQSC